MEIRKPYKARWFYAFGPRKEMIIDNNQNKLARVFGLNQSVISACLRGEGGKKNMKAKTPPPGTITPRQFCNLQSRAGIQNKDLAKLVNLSPDTITRYRSGARHVPEWLINQLREMGNIPRQDSTKHLETAIATGIHHLMVDLYPGWVNTKDTGHIFTG